MSLVMQTFHWHRKTNFTPDWVASSNINALHGSVIVKTAKKLDQDTAKTRKHQDQDTAETTEYQDPDTEGIKTKTMAGQDPVQVQEWKQTSVKIKMT